MKAMQYGLGIGLIILGILGLFLPVLQGILFLVAGFLVLRAHNLKKATRTLKHHLTHVHLVHLRGSHKK